MNFILVFLFILTLKPVVAETIGQSTGYDLPRFVSLKSNLSNLRKGPDTDFPIILTYETINLPIEIVFEYDVWRKVKDVDNNEGWMHESLLKGNRYGVIKTSHNEPAQIYKIPKEFLIGEIGNRNIVKLDKCINQWCHITFKKYKGWVNKINIWGVYKKEDLNIPFYQTLINLYWKISKKINKISFI